MVGLSRLGEDGRIELVERLDDSDSAVRCWAVTGLMSYDMDNNITRKLKHLLQDESLSISLAASDVLCQVGWVDIKLYQPCVMLSKVVSFGHDSVRLLTFPIMDNDNYRK